MINIFRAKAKDVLSSFDLILFVAPYLSFKPVLQKLELSLPSKTITEEESGLYLAGRLYKENYHNITGKPVVVATAELFNKFNKKDSSMYRAGQQYRVNSFGIHGSLVLYANANQIKD